MHRFARFVVGSLAVVALSACSSGTTATGAPAASAAGGGGGGGAAACTNATAAGTVQATIKDFKFAPEPVTAKVGDTVTWTNNDSTTHTVTLDTQPACDVSVSPSQTGSITFSAAGTYAYHCKIHSSMKGTITISG